MNVPTIKLAGTARLHAVCTAQTLAVIGIPRGPHRRMAASPLQRCVFARDYRLLM